MLTILTVAYPLAPVGIDAGGGAEQIAAALDIGLARAGHRSLVVACAGSRVAGELIEVPRTSCVLDDAAIDAARQRHATAVGDALTRHRVDLVHMHGQDYDTYLPAAAVPALATLHCPPGWYSARALRPSRPDTFLSAVSPHQHSALSRMGIDVLGPIENGIDTTAYSETYIKRPYALLLGRIAPEKGVHVALRAAHRAGVALVIAGELHPYPAHRDYYARHVAPLLDAERRWIGPVGLDDKRRLIGESCCLLLCPQIEETSSLAAREALAAGTPVVALARGALNDTIEHGRTGFLAESIDELADGLARAGEIDPKYCRRVARAQFDCRAMVSAYLDLYRRLATKGGAASTGAERAA